MNKTIASWLYFNLFNFDILFDNEDVFWNKSHFDLRFGFKFFRIKFVYNDIVHDRSLFKFNYENKLIFFDILFFNFYINLNKKIYGNKSKHDKRKHKKKI